MIKRVETAYNNFLAVKNRGSHYTKTLIRLTYQFNKTQYRDLATPDTYELTTFSLNQRKRYALRKLSKDGEEQLFINVFYAEGLPLYGELLNPKTKKLQFLFFTLDTENNYLIIESDKIF